MDLPTIENFLAELIRCTQASPDAKISMYDVGAGLGLEKAQAGKLAEEVIAQGWAEIRTLSGAIGLTAEGLQAGGGGTAPNGQKGLSLGREPILPDETLADVEDLISRIQERLNGLALTFPDLEEMVLDIKTARVQLLSPRPKTAILREILRSLQKNLKSAGAGDTAAAIEMFIKG